MVRKGDVVTVVGARRLSGTPYIKYANKRGVVDGLLHSGSAVVTARVIIGRGASARRALIPVRYLESAASVNELRTLSLLRSTKI